MTRRGQTLKQISAVLFSNTFELNLRTDENLEPTELDPSEEEEEPDETRPSSRMEETSLLSLIYLSSLLFCSSNQAHLTVNPRRSQLFEEESVSLTCEGEDRSEGWTLRRRSTEGHVSQCGDGWGRWTGSVCVNSMALERDSGVYWCEGVGGASSSSSSINLTVSGGSVILQSPVLPVMEGHDVTLSCQSQYDHTHSLPADFFKDDVFIGNEPTGHMTLQHVSRSDEGLYRCEIRGHGGSPPSWLSVTGNPEAPSISGDPLNSGAPPTYVAPPPASTSLLIRLVQLVVCCPSSISSLLLVSLC